MLECFSTALTLQWNRLPAGVASAEPPLCQQDYNIKQEHQRFTDNVKWRTVILQLQLPTPCGWKTGLVRANLKVITWCHHITDFSRAHRVRSQRKENSERQLCWGKCLVNVRATGTQVTAGCNHGLQSSISQPTTLKWCVCTLSSHWGPGWSD